MDAFCRLDAGKGFVDYCEDLYGTLAGVLSRFRRYWLRDFDALTAAEKASTHLREQQVLGHVLRGLVEVYETDTMIRPDLPSGFGSESVSRFTLENILSALRSGEESCPVLFGGTAEGLRTIMWTVMRPFPVEWSRFPGQLFKHLQAASRSKSQGAIYPFLECSRCLL